jgi:hypothetical protein
MNSGDHNRNAPADEKRDWRRIHHSPVFWVGILLCLAAIPRFIDSPKNRLPWGDFGIRHGA